MSLVFMHDWECNGVMFDSQLTQRKVGNWGIGEGEIGDCSQSSANIIRWWETLLWSSFTSSSSSSYPPLHLQWKVYVRVWGKRKNWWNMSQNRFQWLLSKRQTRALSTMILQQQQQLSIRRKRRKPRKERWCQSLIGGVEFIISFAVSLIRPVLASSSAGNPLEWTLIRTKGCWWLGSVRPLDLCVDPMVASEEWRHSLEDAPLDKTLLCSSDNRCILHFSSKKNSKETTTSRLTSCISPRRP